MPTRATAILLLALGTAGPAAAAPMNVVRSTAVSETTETETAATPYEVEVGSLESVASAAETAELIGIDRALQLLAQGRGERLQPFIEGLMLRLQPLLAFYRESQGEKPLQTPIKKSSSGK